MKYKAIEEEKLESKTNNNIINLVYRIIYKKKQVLIFNKSKSGAEKTAEDISKYVEGDNKKELMELSDKIINALSSPTQQCLKLAKIIKKGVAFHHSGLINKQRELIEEGFRKGLIKVISSTPTLAAGLNLPAYKVIIKDYKRYSKRGMVNIPVLEYHQMSGRAGRPGFEEIGKAVIYVENESDIDFVVKNYIYGTPEEITSKLSVEPILKTYVLNLIAIGLINKKEDIENFFLNTFYAHHFQDREEFLWNLNKVIEKLLNYNFITREGNIYYATQYGKKINELYLNPDTGYLFLSYFDKLISKFENNVIDGDIFALFHLVSNTIEMKPLFNVPKNLEEEYSFNINKYINNLVLPFFEHYDLDPKEAIKTINISSIFLDWINEVSEKDLCKKYNITPGELNYKLETLDWLLYSLEEISNLKKASLLRVYLSKLRNRIKYGIKEELLFLVSIEGIGRVRARKLYNNNIRSKNDLIKISFGELSAIVGIENAKKLKKYVGIKEYENIKKGLEGIDKNIEKRGNLLDFI